MTSPYATGTVTEFPLSGNNTIDALINWGFKWGAGGVGVGATVTYSFPQAGAEWIGDYYDGEPFNGFQAFNASQQQAARNALALWQDVANITFVEVAETPTVGPVEGNVGDIRFGFSAVVTNDPYAIAWGYFPYSNPGFEFPEAGDVWFDPAYGPNLQMQPGQFGFSTLIHEIGHAIGLDHPFDDGGGEPVLPASMDNNQYTIMAYNGHPHPSVSTEAMTPMLLDILAIQYLYGANMTTRTGDDVYTFSNSNPVLMTIWDAGGNDTIDASNQTTWVGIDLRAGGFSSIGRGYGGSVTINNIAIAYGVTIENAIGGSGDDGIQGNDVANRLFGGSGDDGLSGNGGNDILDGGAGNDRLYGGAGNDTYYVNSTGDVIDEEGNSDIADEIRTTVSINMAVLGAGLIENARAWTDAAINITGNAKGNYILGSIAKNTLDGGAGDDILWGNDGNDLIIGGDGNDYLDGGIGNDTLRGGKGNDIYLIDNINDVIDEQGNTDTGDDVRGYFSFDLNTLGGGAIDRAILFGSDDLNATGNARANRLAGNSGANILDGGGGDDLLLGGDGNDTLIGGNGNDWLSGAGGNDSFKGGAGNDSYVVDSPDEVVDEESNTDTGDQVRATFTVDLETYAGGQIEVAVINGGAALDAYGNAAANLLWGNDAANILDGRGGNDTIIGNGGDDTLIGGEGNDWLDGGGGNDEMKGGSGNDRYIVDSVDDLVDEEGNTDVADEVRATISVDISVLGGGAIENIVLQGSGAIDATGNAGVNKIYGNNGNNVLDGGLGDDILLGGAGNDAYVIDSLADVIDEQGNKDTGDEIRTGAFSIVLAGIGGGAIENATLLGTDDLDITGTSADNKLTGNDGANTLEGGGGNDFISAGKGDDTLIGGGGKDSLYGGDGDDLLYTSMAEGNVIDGGAGFDIWSMSDSTGVHTLFDLNVAAVEQIDINGAGVNALLINHYAVMAASSSDKLILTGGADDWALLSSDFSFAGLQDFNSSTYRSYVSNGVTLLLDANLQVGSQALTSIDLDSLNGANGFTIHGATKDSYFGASVSAAKDINGDGYDDIIGGAPATLASLSRSGDAFVIYGAAAGFGATVDTATLDGSDGFKLSGTSNGSSFGSSVASAGDIDGDGLLDLAVGASTTTVPGLQGAGASHVLLGSDSAFPAVAPSSSFNGSAGFSLTGKSLSEMSGYDIAGVGDMNGDGFDDLLIGAPEDQSNGQYAGSAYVYYGHADPFAATASLSTLNGTKGFSLDGKAGSYLGGSVSGIGDFNGDGLADIIVGAEQSSAAYVVFGRKSGMPASISPTSLNGSNGFSVVDDLDYLRAGHAVSSAGDLNGDGYDEIIITNPFDPRGGSQSGAAYVLFGHGGAQPSSVNISSLNGINGFTILGPEFNRLGADVTCAGDVNGDGYDDLVISSFDYRMGGDTVAYLIYGHGGGYSATMDLDALTSTTGIEIHLTAGTVMMAPAPDVSVSGLGDINGDGFDDFAIGDRSDTVDGETSSGRSHVVFGDETLGQSLVTIGSADDDVLNGQGQADNITGAQGNDILYGNGGADVLNGGQGNDEIHVADSKFFRIDGGTGVDALHLDYSGAIDFGNLDGNAATSDRGRVENIEVIDVANGHANALTLHLADVLDIDATNSNVGGVAALDNVLRIDGESGDTLRLFTGDGWSAADTVTLAGYAIYTYQAVRIAVDTDINVTVS